jgi:hypothetical protein
VPEKLRDVDVDAGRCMLAPDACGPGEEAWATLRLDSCGRETADSVSRALMFVMVLI